MKSAGHKEALSGTDVALLVSAWIEILYLYYLTEGKVVALLVSAWIEIRVAADKYKRFTSRTPRECVD